MNVLVVDDDMVHREMAIESLVSDGMTATGATSAEQALELVGDHGQFDVVVTDYKMPGMTGLELIRRLGLPPAGPPVILVTGMGDEQIAAEAIKAGAQEYVIKDVPRLGYLVVLPAIVREVSRRNELLHENVRLKEQLRDLTAEGPIVARSAAMRRVFDLLEEVAAVDSTVLITGESGTGKELVARAIHDHSPRRDGPFVAASCGAFPETLLESELFGYEEGAFTGARGRRIGRFEKANGGTMFLDEISEISPRAQLDLLRVLQERKFERLGGEQTIEIDVRVLAATNKNLQQMAQRGQFREDLFYRLNVIPIHLPPLRERPEDVAPLAYHFLKRFAQRTGKDVNDFSAAALEALTQYRWPGNVRELENLIERLVVLARRNRIEVGDLPESILQTPTTALPLTVNLAALERSTIARVLEQTGGNLNQAAKRLGISRTTLYSKLRKHKLSVDSATTR